MDGIVIFLDLIIYIKVHKTRLLFWFLLHVNGADLKVKLIVKGIYFKNWSGMYYQIIELLTNNKGRDVG